MFSALHHVALIVSDYARSRHFYVDILGLPVIGEQYREERESWKLDLQLAGGQLEIFSFPSPPCRPSYPEACGLRHLAFAVENLDQCRQYLHSHGIALEAVRCDPTNGRRFCFFSDPDGLPLELYERQKPADSASR